MTHDDIADIIYRVKNAKLLIGTGLYILGETDLNTTMPRGIWKNLGMLEDVKGVYAWKLIGYRY